MGSLFGSYLVQLQRRPASKLDQAANGLTQAHVEYLQRQGSCSLSSMLQCSTTCWGRIFSLCPRWGLLLQLVTTAPCSSVYTSKRKLALLTRNCPCCTGDRRKQKPNPPFFRLNKRCFFSLLYTKCSSPPSAWRPSSGSWSVVMSSAGMSQTIRKSETTHQCETEGNDLLPWPACNTLDSVVHGVASL